MNISPLSSAPPSLQGHEEETDVFTYVIVDCALLDEDFYHKITANKQITSRSLFAGMPHNESAVAGPLLIKMDPVENEDLFTQIQQIESSQPAVVWLWSQQDFKPLLSRLQTLLFGELESGKKYFFRYFDPRCLEGVLSLFNEDNRAQKALKDILGWAYKKDGQYQYLA